MFNKLLSLLGFNHAVAIENTLNLPETKIIYMPRTGENRFKPFYIHRQCSTWAKRSRHYPRGFTAYVSPGKDDRTVEIRMAWCSGKDEFIKKVGRAVARVAEPEYINPRDVPKWLADKSYTLQGWADEHNFYYVLKYML